MKLALNLRPLRWPHGNKRGLILAVGRLRLGFRFWFGRCPTLTHYNVRGNGAHNLRVGPVMVGWQWIAE